MQGTPKEIFNRKEELVKVGLELPLSVVIKDRLIEAGLNIDDGVLTEEELLEAICKL